MRRDSGASVRNCADVQVGVQAGGGKEVLPGNRAVMYASRPRVWSKRAAVESDGGVW